jgi:protein-disulfide isomerase
MKALTLATLCLALVAALAPARARGQRPPWESIPWWGDLDAGERGRVAKIAGEKQAYGACTGTITDCFAKGKRIGWRLARLVIYLVQRGAADEDISRILDERRASAEAPVRPIDVAGTPGFGPSAAGVTVVEFADFECPFCAHVYPLLKEVVGAVGKTRLYFKHFPLKGHRGSVPAAMAATVAHGFGKFWDMAALLFKNPDAHEARDLEGYAREVGIQEGAFRDQMKTPAILKVIERDKDLGLHLGVKATPTLYVNGREFHPARDKFLLQDRIEEEIDNVEKRK